MKIKYFSFLLFFVSNMSGNQTDQVPQDATAQPSISAAAPKEFLMGPHAFGTGMTVFCAAGSEGAGDYTLSQFNGLSFNPLARAEVTINHEPCEKNPFYNKAITHLKTVFNLPLFMTKDQPRTIYYLSSLPNQEQKISALSVTNINDAEKKPCNGILDFTFAETTTSGDPLWYLFAAVKAHDGSFGNKGSGIALMKFKARPVDDWQNNVEFDEHNQPEKNKEKKGSEEITREYKFYINTMDAEHGILGGNKAIPFDIEPSDTPLIQINGGLDYINKHAVDLFWEENFNRLYIALQIKTKDDAQTDQGACALLVGSLWNDVLTLRPLASSNVFSHNADNIIGAVGAGRYVSLHKVRALHSTTGMQYLIVVGGNGKPEETRNKVFALPMSNIGNRPISVQEVHTTEKHGGIAKRSSNPSTRFFPGNFGRFIGRYVGEIAQDARDFYTADDVAVCVGGNTILPSAIKEIFTARDCVIVLVDQEGNGQEGGAFYSQAIFDQNGCIAAWSSWKRIQGSRPNILGLNIDPQQFSFSFFEQTGNHLALRINQWHYETAKSDNTNQSLSSLVNQVLPQQEGGVQGLFDFHLNYPGISGNEKTSLIVATGNKKVLLIQTGHDDQNGIFRAQHTFESIAYKNNGSIHENLPENTQALAIEGGILDELGPITSAEILSNNNNSWLILGGVGGVAILCDERGNGWPTKDGIGKSFSSLNSHLRFQKIGNYSFVQKLHAHNNYLYIMTDDKLDYISLNSDFVNNCTAKTLVTKNQFGGYFSDVLISDACILLATGDGLFLGAEDFVHAPDTITWQKIELPGMSLPALKFFTITSNNCESNFIHKSQVYVLSGSVAHAKAEVHRLFLDNGQVECVRDYGFKNFVSRFINFGGFRTNFATDGLVHLSTRGAGGPLIHVLPAFIAGKAIASSRGYLVPLDIGNISNICYITKNSATGSWLVGGDFGVYSYE